MCNARKRGNGEAVWERVNEWVEGRVLGRALKVLVSKAECVIHLESVCVRVCTYMFFGSGFCYRPCGCVCVCVRGGHTVAWYQVPLQALLPSSEGASRFFSGSPIPSFCWSLTVNEGWEAQERPSRDGRKAAQKKKRRAENAAHHLVVCIDCSQMGDRWKGFRSEGG